MPSQTQTLLAPPLTNNREILEKFKLKSRARVDCRLIEDLSLASFKKLLGRSLAEKTKLKKGLVLIEADLLFPLGPPPFLFLQTIKEKNPKLNLSFLIHQNLLAESLHRRFFKLNFLFEKLIYIPLEKNNLPFQNQTQAKNFLLALNENQRLILRLLVRGLKIPPQLKEEKIYLEKLRIINQHYGKWRLCSPLLTKAAMEIAAPAKEKLTLKNQQVYIGQEKITSQFSPQQKSLLILLLTNQGQVVKREEIAKKLWKKDWQEKYSDWAIDQLIYKLRKKLTRLWIRPEIIKVKKRQGVLLGKGKAY